MDLITVLGVTCLGILVGVLVGYYVNEAKKMDYSVLQGSIWVLAGAGVVAVFSLVGGSHEPTREYWFYPMGLLVGFLVSPHYSSFLDRMAKPKAKNPAPTGQHQ
jgi:hypothetical protein